MSEAAKTYSQMRKEFFDNYTNKIVPIVQKYEQTRKKKLLLAIILSTFFFVLASIILYFTLKSGDSSVRSNRGLLNLIVLLYVLSGVSWTWIKKNFENKIKARIMPTVCSCFGDMKWLNSYVGSEVFLASCVVPKFTSESYDDVFEGSFKGVNIEIVESMYEVGSGRHRRTIFDGVIVKLVMNKDFISHTVIKPNSLLKFSPSADLHHTEFEDIEFNKKFDVFTNDEVDARYLITPSFMERLKSMKTAFNADEVSCAFFGNLLIVALKTHEDLFSLCSLVKSIDDPNQYFKMYQEIVSIIKLIDYFNLDQKIGL